MWTLLAAAALAADIGALEQLLVDELDRATAALADTEPPYYTAITVEDWTEWTLAARDGALATAHHEDSRYLEVDLRVGSPELDSTHALRGFSSLEYDSRRVLQVPLDEGYALRHALWRQLDERARESAERIVVIRANRNVKVAEEAPAPDFEPREPTVDRREVPPLVVDEEAWSGVLVDVSRTLATHPDAHRSAVTLDADRVRKTFVDTEGTRLVHGRRHARLSLVVATTADDGDEVQVFRARDVHDPASLDPAELTRWADEALAQLEALRDAPRGDPYSGPVLLRGEAAGVFFHEVLGHRVEGHRQKREDEGRTFAEQVGRPVLPDWIDVVDDPGVEHLAGHDLNGHYDYDDEGVPAMPAPIVDDGRFVGFLMGRSPIPGFEHSNGHGRRSVGSAPQARMGNTLVRASRTVPVDTLRAQLVAEVRDQGLEYGYIVDEIEGGFTMTGRVTPNAFNVRASTTWRVFADGRPDELVRGIDLVGTPLVAFGNLIAAGDDPSVFNGTCGAESGWVPVSAVAPSLLFRKLEFQLKEKGQERPPLLTKPDVRRDDGASWLEEAP